jgi:hypothetical protein
MKENKSDLRTPLTDEYVVAVLCIGTPTITSNIGKPV